MSAKKKSKSNEPNIKDFTKNNSQKIHSKIFRIIFGRTVAQRMFRIYLILIFLGASLLYCPFSLTDGQYIVYLDPINKEFSRPYTFWDALFIACSGFSDTGLTPAVISETFTFTGQIILLFLIELGGIGLISIFFLIWNFFKKASDVSLGQMAMLQSERGNEKFGNSFKMVKKAIGFIIISELIFAFIYSLWMCFVPAYTQLTQENDVIGPTYDSKELLKCYHNYGKSLWIGIFISISAINNAGFDIFQGTSSLSSYRNDWHTIFQLLIVFQIIIGGIGYPVIFDYLEKLDNKKKGKITRTSLFTKVALWAYFGVAIIGFIIALLFEGIEPRFATNDYSIFSDPNLHREYGVAKDFNKFFAIFFNVMTTRSAGFSTINHNLLSIGTKWTNCLLMFIGGSPSSTAGGIRTTTLIVVLAALCGKITGKKHTSLFRRTISVEKVKDALIVLITSIILIAFVSVLISYSEYYNYDYGKIEADQLLDIIYETTSAFGTVGLSIGITPSIDPFGQVLLILLMFVGQLGVSSTLLSWTRRNPKGNASSYPVEDIRIG